MYKSIFGKMFYVFILIVFCLYPCMAAKIEGYDQVTGKRGGIFHGPTLNGSYLGKDKNSSYTLLFKRFSPGLKWMQDADLYNNTLFIPTGYNNFYVFDWDDNTCIGGPFRWGSGDKLHCNSISFGTKRKKSDAFPVLYCSVGDNDRGACYVYSIGKDYGTERVQTIRVDFISDSIWRGETKSSVKGRDGNGYYVVDTENKFLYIVITRATSKNSATGRVFKFVLPDLSMKDVVLQKSDILDYFDFPFYPVLQGLHINKGVLYVTSGFHKCVKNEYYLVAIDLVRKKEIWNYNTSGNFIEMEGVWTDTENRLYFSGYDTNCVTQIYRLRRRISDETF